MPRLWLVGREYDDKGLIQLTYATPDGERVHRRELSEHRADRGAVTAAIERDDAGLRPADPDERERFAAEASRMAERHDPDGEV